MAAKLSKSVEEEYATIITDLDSMPDLMGVTILGNHEPS